MEPATVNNLFGIFILISISRILPVTSQSNLNRYLHNTTCIHDYNCTENAFCHLTGKCFCKDGYVPEKVFNKPKDYYITCIKEASVIGDPCDKDVQCKAAFGTHSICEFEEKIGKCRCANDSHHRDGICYKTALIGETCEVNDNCLVKSKGVLAYCEYSSCICPPGSHPTEDRTDCQSRSGLGGPCKDNLGCSIENSECRYEFCRCKHKFIPSKEKSSCLLMAEQVGDPCEEQDQCRFFLTHAVCQKEMNVCICEDGFHNVSGRCWKSARLLEPCGHTAECLANNILGSLECARGVCICKEGYTLQNQSYCLKINATEKSRGHTLTSHILTIAYCILVYIYL